MVPPPVGSGLADAEAADRLKRDGYNELPSAQPRNLLAIGLDVVREPMLLLLIASGAVYLVLGDLEEAVALVAAVFLVIGITLYQEHKTERALQALRDLSSPRALVIRGGVTKRIAGRDVVRGDLVVLREGDRVPADARVLSSSGLSVDESLLTGESVPVRKTSDEPLVYSGTLIVRGDGVARVHATGAATELGRIGKALAQVDVGRTALQVEVARMVRVLAVLGLGACAAVAVAYGLTRGRWIDGALAGLTTAIAMVPEEFPVVLTIFLALGAWRISRSRVLTRRIPAIETLGSATVLCVDKTGTLTMNRMSVSAIAAEPGVPEPQVVEAAILASKRDPFDPMERAFADLGQQLGVLPHPDDWTLVREYPLSDQLLAVTQAWERSDRPDVVVAVKGAPELIAQFCRLDEDDTRRVVEQVDAMAKQGLRVLGVGRCAYARTALPESPRDFPFEFLGLVGLSDPVRPGVPEAIRECRAARIRVVMITGDYPATALNIARQIGLTRSDRCLTGADLSHIDDVELQRRVAEVDVFARMIPKQKLRLVSALQARGEVVAMTGDGVNDAPALKAAHIGIAMGARGTDVAREAAALVLLDDDFSSIVRAIRLGRRIYDNIKKAMAYVLAIHVPIGGVSLVPVLFGRPLLLMPVHIIFMELIIDPASSVAFEMEPEETDVMTRPPRDSSRPLFTPRMVVRSLVQGGGACGIALVVYLGALRAGASEADVRTLTFTTLIVVNLVLIFANRSFTRSALSAWRTPNPALRWLAAGALVTLAGVLYIPFWRELFRLAPPHLNDAAICAAAGAAGVLWMEIVKVFVRRTIP